MADIRINSLSTTASASSSDDFLAIDGATNGTRKLNAFSPTFGGNLTVSGTATIGPSADVKLSRGPSGAGNLAVTAATDGYSEITARGAAGNLRIFSSYTGGNFNWYWGADASAQTGSNAGSNFVLVAGSDTGSSLGTYLTVNRATAAATLAGNLTVSGTGTSSVAGNVGIGTTTPDPTSSGGRVLTVSGNFTRSRLQLHNTDGTSVGSVAGTVQWIAASTGLATIDVGSETAANNAYMAFSTAVSGTGAEAMRIAASTRNLIVGSPFTDGGQKLQVNGTAFASRYDVGYNDNPTGTSPKIFASAASGSTVDVLIAGGGSRSGNIQYYNDGGGTSQFKFGTSVPSSTTEHVRFNMPTSGLGSSVVSIYGTTASTSTSSGALQVSGGVGVAGAVNVGTFYGMVDGVTAPSATSGYAKIYVDTADGDLKVIFGDGTIKTIATDS